MLPHTDILIIIIIIIDQYMYTMHRYWSALVTAQRQIRVAVIMFLKRNKRQTS